MSKANTEKIIQQEMNLSIDEFIEKAKSELAKYEENLREKELLRQQRKEEAKEEGSSSLEKADSPSNIIDLSWDIFDGKQTEDTKVPSVSSVEDGLISSLNTKGKVDINYIARSCGMDQREVISKLNGVIFQNPLKWREDYTMGWELADMYLSGNIIKKYKQAVEANKTYLGVFQSNIDALKSVMPNQISAEEIYITLGSPWVPEDIIDDFIYYLAGSKKPYNHDDYYKTRHDNFTGIWQIPFKSRFKHTKASVRSCVTYGTSRMEMLNILEATLNMRTPNVKKEIISPTDKCKIIRVTDEKETMLAIEKQDMLIKTFQDWVWTDEKRTKRLKEIYEENFAGIRQRTFNGSLLTFPNMSKDVQLYPYQKNAVARILYSPNVLLAHSVGSGKTYEMIAAGMELRRIGISKKNLYVVPNNIIGQWKSIFLEMYPDANLFVIEPSNFPKEKRDSILKRIAKEDFDGIIMAYSCFDMLPLSEKYYKDYYKQQSDKLIAAKKAFFSDAPIDRRLRSINDALKKLHEKKIPYEYSLTFDKLGINTLFVDEAHNYKNVPIDTKVTFNHSVNANGSTKCQLMMDRVQCVQAQNGGRGVVFATGTPITNSVTDLFVMQKYLQSGELALLGIQNFDAWVGMFAEKVSAYEIDVDTNSYHLVSRFANFHNLPELSSILSSIADFHEADEDNDIPKVDGYDNTEIEGNIAFKKYLEDISYRAEAVRTRRISKEKDNLLKITTDGRKAALDMRLIDPKKYEFVSNTKAEACAKNVFDIYTKTKGKKSTQLIFCDTSTPKDGFNMYDEIKRLLLVKGIPSNEIEYIHEATTEKKREKLFRDVREGKVRVLMGSTYKLGLGVNVQDKLIAIHHFDCPWRPADMVQREGRILRQGNENEKVKIFRYITKGSFDAYSWQLLETKQRFISQLLAGSISDRSGGDVDETVLDYAEVKALAVGNPAIKNRCEISNQLDKLRVLQRAYNENRSKLVQELALIPDKIKRQKVLINYCELDKKAYKENKRFYDSKEAKAFREKVAITLNGNFDRPEETYITTYQGFKLFVPAYMRQADSKIMLKLNGRYYIELGSEAGISIRINNLLENFDEQIDKHKDAIKALKLRETGIKEELSTDEGHEEEIARLSKKLKKLDEELGLKK